MEMKNKTFLILKVTLLSFIIFGFLLVNSIAAEAESTDPNLNSKYLEAVREFADNVLKYGRDIYGPKQTPLFVDGLNIHTHEPVKWKSPRKDLLREWQIGRYGGIGAEGWILSNFASQQTLLRTLDGLTMLTGDPKYREAAMQATKYAFENLKSPNGILYWGGATAYDALGDTVCGDKDGEVLKLDYPYYELMWKVDPKATEQLIGVIWSGHVIDWSNLEIDRFGLRSEDLEEPWNHEYKEGPTFFEGKRSWGSSNMLTASSLIHAGVTLNKLSGEQQPLVWSKRLAKRFVDTRHPNTGISSVLNNGLDWIKLAENKEDYFRNTYISVFPWDFLVNSFRRAFPENAQAHPWMVFFLAGELLGEEGKEFTNWALEELTAWGKVSYRKRDNCFVPVIRDGTILEGYVWKNGPGQSFGYNIVKLCPADMPFFWAYSIAYGKTGDEFMWEMVRNIALGNGFGDIGQTPTSNPALQINTTCSHPYGIFGFLELYRRTNQPVYLEIARRIADNMLEDRFCKGFFVPSKKHFYTRFACFEPLALLCLEAAMRSKCDSVPQPWPALPLFAHGYRCKKLAYDRDVIYGLIESSEPLFSIEEAAAVGNVDLIKRLVEKGAKVGAFDSLSYMTALHRAAMEGHESAVEFLLTKGAPVNERDLDLNTPLHYAVERGHKGVVELLLAYGADVNRKDGWDYGEAPLDIAIGSGHVDIAKLLIEKGARVSSIHIAGRLGLYGEVEKFLDRGMDVDAQDRIGQTPLHMAAEAGHLDIVKLLLKNGADINAKDSRGRTALDLAQKAEHKEIVELLRKSELKE